VSARGPRTDAAFGRRELLRAAGGTLCVPLFVRQAFAAPEELPPRLVIIMQANGTHQRAFWPDRATGTSKILDPIVRHESIRAKTIVLKGVRNDQAGFGNEHDRGFNSLWTGVAPVGSMEDCFGGGPSIDQIVKQKLRPAVPYPSLACGVLAADVGPKNGHRTSFSYVGAKQQVPTQVDPYRVYGALFTRPGDGGDPDRARRRLALKKSVLDAVAADLAALAGRVGAGERRKLDAHLSALREFEQRLSSTVAPTPASCRKPAAPAAGLDVWKEDNVPRLAALMLDLVAAGLACNLTRVVTIQLGYSGNNWRYRWLGIDKDSHEELAHKDTLEGDNVEVATAMTQISTWVAEHVSRFVRALDALPEGEGTCLDRSLVVWANENGTGFHSMDNLPVVLFGRAGGRLRRSGLVDAGTQSHRRLCTTVLNLMGIEAEGFGLEPACGPLAGLA
jgi:hypothetical protein